MFLLLNIIQSVGRWGVSDGSPELSHKQFAHFPPRADGISGKPLEPVMSVIPEGCSQQATFCEVWNLVDLHLSVKPAKILHGIRGSVKSQVANPPVDTR